MVIARTVKELRAARLELGADLGFVPTMGALHEGHRSLLRRARAECGAVAASIFVNPLQFAAGEDLDKYPRTFTADCAMLEAEGVDLLFAPAVAEMYPQGAVTLVQVRGLEDRLDGASRPGHFAGVATVVAKLFHLVQPQRAYFGQKDAAQVAVLRRMVRDLDFDLEVVACPTVREADGLALSSRNRYLSAEERETALVLWRTLRWIVGRITEGERGAGVLLAAGRGLVESAGGLRLDYLAVVDAETLLPVDVVAPGTLVAVAAWVGGTRLIDNVVLELADGHGNATGGPLVSLRMISWLFEGELERQAQTRISFGNDKQRTT